MESKENVPPRAFSFKNTKPNRRHTLVPSHSILKAGFDDNNTIAVIPSAQREKRRVSFAPEVTLHKIAHYSGRATTERRSSRRLSLPMLHSYQKNLQVGKSILKRDLSEEKEEEEEDEEDYSQKVKRVKLSEVAAPAMAIDDDTQTMEFSVDMTDQLKGRKESLVSQTETKSAGNGAGNDDTTKLLDGTNMFQDAVRELQEETRSPRLSLESDVEQTMEFTKPIVQPSRLSIMSDNETATMEMASRRGTLVGMEEDTKTMELTKPVKRVEEPEQEVNVADVAQSQEVEKIPSENVAEDVAEEKDSSKANSSYTEFVPLAEISTTRDSIASSDYDGEEYDDDDYQNVTLSSFLQEVSVQFFDGMDPSERELSVEINSSHKASLLEYVKAVNSIPEFRYFEHLINQYKSSIQSIRQIVQDFEQNVKENNPTSIREYYEQEESLRLDLKVNYQALASYARQKAKKENLTYLLNLLEQLKKSYEDTSSGLDVQIEKAIAARKEILARQGKLIQRKVDLRNAISRLEHQKAVVRPEEKARCETLKSRINAILAKRGDMEMQSKLVQERSGEYRRSLESLKGNVDQLRGSVSTLERKMTGLKVPDSSDIQSAEQKLSSLEEKSGIKLVGLEGTELRVVVLNDVRVSVDLTTGRHELEVDYHNEQFTELVRKVTLKLQAIQYTSVKEFLRQVRQTWKEFKGLLKDLTMLTLRYQSSKDEIVMYNPGQYRMVLRYDEEELLQFGEPVKVDAQLTVWTKESKDPKDALNEMIQRSRLEIPTLRRFQVSIR